MSKLLLAAVAAALLAAVSTVAAIAQEPKSAAPKPEVQEAKGRDYSGMYSFLKEGEFVQITVEDEGRVTGFISRYGEGESDKGAFLDQYFRSGKLDGDKLTFTTETVHGTWFDFTGVVQRGEGKNPQDEAYYTLKGVLKDSSSGAQKKSTTHSQEVTFRRFPSEASPQATSRN